MTLEDLFENIPTLKTERLVLKQIDLSDAPALFSIKSDAEGTSKYGREPHKNLEETKRWVKQLITNFKEKESLAWSIHLQDTDEAIGLVTLWNLDPESFVGELGYELHRNYWRRGIMFDALKAVIDWLMRETPLNRIEACPIKENIPSVKMLEKLGFKYEGNLRERIYFHGRFWDQYYFSMLKSDWATSGKIE